jgi:hypothetical protein
MTPREYSSGSSRYLGRFSKRGDRYPRMLLTHGTRSVLRAAKVAEGAGKEVCGIRRWALDVQGRSNQQLGCTRESWGECLRLNATGVDHERHRMIKPSQHDKLDELFGREVCRKLCPRGVVDVARIVKLIGEFNNQLVFDGPTVVRGFPMNRRSDLRWRPLGFDAKAGNVNTPLVFSAAARASAQNHQLATAKGNAASIE